MKGRWIRDPPVCFPVEEDGHANQLNRRSEEREDADEEREAAVEVGSPNWIKGAVACDELTTREEETPASEAGLVHAHGDHDAEGEDDCDTVAC